MENSNTSPQSLLEDAFNALDEGKRKTNVLADVLNRCDLAIYVKGNCLTTKKTNYYGEHSYDKNRHPMHVITIFRSTRKNMLRATIHELIHVWQFEMKKDWVLEGDERFPANLGDESYMLNRAEREARSYEALAAAFLRKESKANDAHHREICMIREDIIKAEALIDTGNVRKAMTAMEAISSKITKYELLEGELTLRQTAKIVEYRAQYQEDIMYLADAKAKKDSKGDRS